MTKTALAMVVLIAMTVGCGGGSSSGIPSQVQVSQLPALWSQTVCDQNFKCASTADIMGRMKSDCVSTNMTAWQFVTASVADGESKGRLGYDATMMGTCLSTLAGQTCADWLTGLAHPPECNGAFIAKVQVGGACQSDFECVMGHCDGADSSTKPPTDGMCKPTLAHGAACTFADTCVDTDYCDPDAMMCVGKKAGAAACTSDDECGNSCNSDTHQCSGYAGCSVGPVTPRATLLSALGLALAFSAARRRRRRL